MTTPNTDPQTWARAALLAFLRRTYSQLANEAQRDSLAFRAALKALS